MKKVLFLIHDLHYGGAEKVLVNLVNNLDKSKYDVTVQTLFDVGHNKHYLNDDVHYIGGFKRFIKGNSKIQKLFSPKFLASIIISDQYDLVIAFLQGPCARIVSGYNGKKIVWEHNENKRANDAIGSYKNYNEFVKCYNSFNKIICVAETVKDNFIKLFPEVKAPIITLYNVNQTDYIIEQSKESQNIINHSEQCFNIISVGRLIISHKGFERLISIHNKLIVNGINNKLYILGEGPDRKKLMELINRLGVSDTCILLGFDENPYKYISSADLFVCSSYKEGFSTAVTEALILGIPVVSTEVSGAKELLGNNNEYGIVTKNSENALYNGVYSVLSNKKELENYKAKAIIRGKDFNTTNTTKAAEDMLESVING